MALPTYQLVEFADDGVEPKSVDCIPLTWIKYDSKLGQCFAQFVPPPYTLQKFKLLQKMCKETQPPNADWPRYPVNIRGHAAPYSEGLRRIEKLKSEDFAYTTGCDNPEGKSRKAVDHFINEARTDPTKLDDLMKVPTLETPLNESDPSSADDASFDVSSDESVAIKKKASSQRLKRRRQKENEKPAESFKLVKRGAGKKLLGSVSKSKTVFKNQTPLSTHEQPTRAYTPSGACAEQVDWKLILNEIRQVAYKVSELKTTMHEIRQDLDGMRSANIIMGESLEHKSGVFPSPPSMIWLSSMVGLRTTKLFVNLCGNQYFEGGKPKSPSQKI